MAKSVKKVEKTTTQKGGKIVKRSVKSGSYTKSKKRKNTTDGTGPKRK